MCHLSAILFFLCTTVSLSSAAYSCFSCQSCGSHSDIIIPSTVTYIPSNAFYNCQTIVSATIPASVTGIASQAFFRSSLQSLVVSARVIGDGAFYSNQNLVSITISQSVLSIGNQAFFQCNNLNSLTFLATSSLQTIADGAFYGCSSLNTLNLPASVTYVGTQAFYGSNLITLSIPSPSITLGGEAFGQNGQTVCPICFTYAGVQSQFPYCSYIPCDILTVI